MPTRITTKRTAKVAPVEKVRTLKRAMEWASLSILGLAVRAPHACKTGAAMAKPTKISAKNMWMSITKPVTKSAPPISENASERRSEEHTSELQSRQYLVC